MSFQFQKGFGNEQTTFISSDSSYDFRKFGLDSTGNFYSLVWGRDLPFTNMITLLKYNASFEFVEALNLELGEDVYLDLESANTFSFQLQSDGTIWLSCVVKNTISNTYIVKIKKFNSGGSLISSDILTDITTLNGKIYGVDIHLDQFNHLYVNNFYKQILQYDLSLNLLKQFTGSYIGITTSPTGVVCTTLTSPVVDGNSPVNNYSNLILQTLDGNGIVDGSFALLSNKYNPIVGSLNTDGSGNFIVTFGFVADGNIDREVRVLNNSLSVVQTKSELLSASLHPQFFYDNIFETINSLNGNLVSYDYLNGYPFVVESVYTTVASGSEFINLEIIDPLLNNVTDWSPAEFDHQVGTNLVEFKDGSNATLDLFIDSMMINGLGRYRTNIDLSEFFFNYDGTYRPYMSWSPETQLQALRFLANRDFMKQLSDKTTTRVNVDNVRDGVKAILKVEYLDSTGAVYRTKQKIVATRPGTIRNFKVTQIGNDLKLSWSRINSADSVYDGLHLYLNGVLFKTIDKSAISGFSCMATGHNLASGDYQFILTAYNTRYEGLPSNTFKLHIN